MVGTRNWARWVPRLQLVPLLFCGDCGGQGKSLTKILPRHFPQWSYCIPWRQLSGTRFCCYATRICHGPGTFWVHPRMCYVRCAFSCDGCRIPLATALAKTLPATCLKRYQDNRRVCFATAKWESFARTPCANLDARDCDWLYFLYLQLN